MHTKIDLFIPSTSQFTSYFSISNTNWSFISQTKRYMLENHKATPLTNNQTILKTLT